MVCAGDGGVYYCEGIILLTNAFKIQILYQQVISFYNTDCDYKKIKHSNHLILLTLTQFLASCMDSNIGLRISCSRGSSIRVGVKNPVVSQGVNMWRIS